LFGTVLWSYNYYKDKNTQVLPDLPIETVFVILGMLMHIDHQGDKNMGSGTTLSGDLSYRWELCTELNQTDTDSDQSESTSHKGVAG
jgi:hypothetical protein